jgi:hypothetical protein
MAMKGTLFESLYDEFREVGLIVFKLDVLIDRHEPGQPAREYGFI